MPSSEISSSDVFRFIQLKPIRPPAESTTVPLVADTALAVALAGAADLAQRIELANGALKPGTAVRTPADVPLGSEITAALRTLKQAPAATYAQLVSAVPGLSQLGGSNNFNAKRLALSDALLASFYATRDLPVDLAALQDVYRVYELVRTAAPASTVLAGYLARRLLAPRPRRYDDPAAPPAPTGGGTTTTPGGGTAPSTKAAALAQAITELARLDRPEHLVQPDENGLPVANAGLPFTVKAESRQSLSKATETLLVQQAIDLDTLPVDSAIQLLAGDHLLEAKHLVAWPRPIVVKHPHVPLPDPAPRALVRPAGVADLLVVKQQIKRFEAGEIAHVENVLIGEKKSRAHRRLERIEETTETEAEITSDRQTELETADRFELNRETSRTVERDQQMGLGLSLSGKYGPSVEFSSDFQLDTSTSSSEASRSSSSYARDVVSRSLERITERVRELRSRTTIRETEETNLHELHNTTEAHVRGVYQFLDKVYEAQVFNYGKREMFDFMVPEPASFLWHVEQHPNLDLDLPPAPEKLELVLRDASEVMPGNAMELAARFGATDIEAPPPLYMLLSTGVEHGGDADDGDETGRPRSAKRVELTVPEGYRPLRARIQGAALTDALPAFGVIVGSAKAMWKPTATQMTDIDGTGKIAHQPRLFLDLTTDSYELSDSKLSVSVLAYESATYTVHVTVVVVRTESALDRWRLATYKKIKAAYDERLREYQSKVEELTAAAEAAAERAQRRPFGAPPAENARTISTELKKHCISILTQQRYDAFDATRAGDPPWFSFEEAAAEGAYIRFFEQAFEWDQMQYVFYPYFWARKSTWIDRFVKQDADPRFLEFLKAGSARVVVPVRPGFEVAITHFAETGKVWSGEGEPPQINSPLYVSIVDEIRERTGASQGELAVGEPWDVRVPTALAILRDRKDLPAWERTAPGVWSWKPVETP